MAAGKSRRGRTGLGKDGEDKAAAFLEEKGLRILGRNIRYRTGEVDLVALDGDTLVFVEVKTWSVFTEDSLQHGISLKKQRRIIETAKYFLTVHREYNCMAVRFDVILICSDRIIHLDSAFMEDI